MFPFRFVKYIQPHWYFLLKPGKDLGIFQNPESIPQEIRSLLKSDDGYSDNNANLVDLSWQAMQKGYISDTKSSLNLNVEIPIQDEYRFVAKYYNPVWRFYIFFIRIFSLCNPIKEIYGLLKSLSVKRISLFSEVIQHNTSSSDSDQPKVSVIIPTLNRYIYLKDVLHDLEKQEYSNFDVIIIDQSEPFQKEFYTNFKLDIKLKYQEEKALWNARNTAVKWSDADYVLLFDDDSRVDPNWISAHLACIRHFNADISSGVSLSAVGAKIPPHYNHYRWSDQIDTGNVMIDKKVFQTTGLFDRQFEKQRMGDAEFGLRAYLSGFKNVSNPKAKRIHLKVPEGGLRQMGSWDAFRPSSILAPRPVPSVLYLVRKYFGSRAARLLILNSVIPSIIPYKFKRYPVLLFLSFIPGILFLPLISISVYRSWKQSGQKLSEGEIIELFK